MEVSGLAEIEQEENRELTPAAANGERARSTEASKGKRNPMALTIGWILLATAAILLFQSISTYAEGLTTLQYKSLAARVDSIDTVFNSFDQNKICKMSFELKGKNYKTEVPLPPNRIVKENELVQLYFDANNPLKASLTQEVDYDTTIVKGSFGLFALCFAILVLRKNR